jgi:thiol-disulfide isomerase/thioredoxin
MKKIIGILLLSVITLLAKDGPSIGDVAPQFQGTTLKGEKFDLTDFQGKVILIDFWASWCGPCRQEMPYLIELQQKYKKSDFEIIAVNIDDKISNAIKFINEISGTINFPVINDSQQEIPPKFQIKGMPSTILVDKKGVIRYWHTGFKNSYKEDYVSEIDKLLAE